MITIRNKSLLALLVPILCLALFGGCANELLQNMPGQTKQAVFNTYYDYGFHRPDKAVLLMDGSTVFVDGELVAGDVVCVSYTGELYVQETYPSTVVLHGGSVQGVDVQKAKICELRVVQNEQTGEKRLVSPYDTRIESAPDYVLTDTDGSFIAWKDLASGTILYCSYASEQGNAPTNIAGLYTYLPRE